jgi:hypothetical protein
MKLLESFKDGTLIGLIFAATQAPVKAVVETFISSERQTTL